MLRKVAITFLAFCANRFDSVTPISGIAYVITFAIVAHILAMPYRERFNELNKLEVAVLFVSQMTTQAATMLKDGGFPHNYLRELLTVACVLLNVVRAARCAGRRRRACGCEAAGNDERTRINVNVFSDVHFVVSSLPCRHFQSIT